MGESCTIPFVKYLERLLLCHQWMWLSSGMSVHNKRSRRPPWIPPCAKNRPSRQVLQILSASRDDNILPLCVSSSLAQVQAGPWPLVMPYFWSYHLPTQASLIY